MHVLSRKRSVLRFSALNVLSQLLQSNPLAVAAESACAGSYGEDSGHRQCAVVTWPSGLSKHARTLNDHVLPRHGEGYGATGPADAIHRQPPPIPGESRWQSAKHVHVQWPAKCGAPEMSCRGAGQAFAPVGSLARGSGPRPPMLPGRSSIGHRKRKTTTHHHVPIANPRLGRPRRPLPARWSSPSYSSRTASTFCPATSPRPDIPGPRGPVTDSSAEGRPGWPNGMRRTP